VNVRNLRPVARPYDHEQEHNVWVQLSPIEWSVLVAGAERSTLVAAREVAANVAEQVMAVQLARFAADIADANHDYPEGAA
jgi:hypothetical protein